MGYGQQPQQNTLDHAPPPSSQTQQPEQASGGIDTNVGGSSAPAGYDPFGFDAGLESQVFFGSSGQDVPDLSTQDVGSIDRAYKHDEGNGGQGTGITATKASEFISQAAQYPPEKLILLQQRLKDAGFKVDVTGYFDPDTLNALQELEREALQQQGSLDDTLNKRIAGVKRAGADASASAAFDQYKTALTSKYFEVWGVPPAPGYIDAIAKSGMNIYEFDHHERSKPGYVNSPKYQQNRIALERQAAEYFGALG